MLNKIEEALEDLRQGKMVIVVDDEDRENEGDLVLAADKVTPEAINFMIKHGKGLVCVPMEDRDLQRLNLPPMVTTNTDPHHTAFTVSIDHIQTTTGISAQDRAKTIKELLNPMSKPIDFKRPGHIFPLRARDGGVFARPGHTEAAVDLARLADLYPAGVICEIIQDDGTMARLPELQRLAQEWGLKIISIADLIIYRQRCEKSVSREIQITLPTKFGEYTMFGYSTPDNREPHLALVKGKITQGDSPVLVRVHSECLTGDVFGSERCDCGDQLARSLEKINQIGRGILLYLRQEGRGIGLLNKLKAYKLQETGLDTVEANLRLGFDAELRDFQVAAAILQDLGVNRITLMTNNPLKITDLTKYGIQVVSREPLEITPTCNNLHYLKTKQKKMGHLFSSELVQ